MKIALITTVRHNVGDDFVREGLMHLLRQYFKGKRLRFYNIHKHIPATCRDGFASLRHVRWGERVEKYLPIIPALDKVMKSDMLIQSGAPVYWYHKGQGDSATGIEWYGPLIRDRFLKKKKGVLANIAAGTCQVYHSNGSEFLESAAVCDFIREFYELSRVTTLRDDLSGWLLNELGLEAPVIPCSSIFAINEHRVQPQRGEYVVVNYMHGGAHYAFQKTIDFEGWFNHFKDFYFQLKKKEERVIFSCHNQKEVDEAKTVDPDASIFFSQDFRDYLRFYAKAKYGVMNRVHGGFILASLGKPAIVIGNDSRARMANQVNVKHYYVNDPTAQVLLDEAQRLESERESFPGVIQAIKEKAFASYMKAFEKFG